MNAERTVNVMSIMSCITLLMAACLYLYVMTVRETYHHRGVVEMCEDFGGTYNDQYRLCAGVDYIDQKG